MTDNEIIMTMRYFASQKLVVNQSTGQVLIMQDILDLINRQQAEIERLTDMIHRQSDVVEEQRDMLDEIKTARSGVIKEFAERVCEGRVANDPVVIAVRYAVKEMTEGV